MPETAEYVEMPSGLLLPEWLAEEEVKKGMRPKGVDLFCGCGGFSLGAIKAGFEMVAGCDNDPLAALTYMDNLGTYPCQFHFVEPEDEARLEKLLMKGMAKTGVSKMRVAGAGWIKHARPGTPGASHFFLGDLRKLRGRDILDAIGLEVGELDMVCGSPPCQGFSIAGKRNVVDPRNSLVFEFARLVVEMRPKTLMFENVPGIMSMVTPDGLPVMDAFCRVLEDGNFGALDSFRRSIERQTNCVGLLRGRKRPARIAKKLSRKKKRAPKQAALELA